MIEPWSLEGLSNRFFVPTPKDAVSPSIERHVVAPVTECIDIGEHKARPVDTGPTDYLGRGDFGIRVDFNVNPTPATLIRPGRHGFREHGQILVRWNTATDGRPYAGDLDLPDTTTMRQCERYALTM